MVAFFQSLGNALGSGTDYGVFAGAFSSGNSLNYGGWFEARNSPNSNIGVFATAPITGTSNWAGYFAGDFYYSGNWLVPSDSHLKTNIDSIANASTLLSQLHPRTYQFLTNDYPSMKLPSGTRYGFLAQEYETAFPQFVKTTVQPATFDSSGNVLDSSVTFKSISTNELIPLLVKGFQEQNQKTDSLITRQSNQSDSILSLQNQIADLQQQINNCCNSGGGSGIGARKAKPGGAYPDRKVTELELASTRTLILDQNAPNPFEDLTEINYLIPDDVKHAKIIFFDNLGRVIKEVDVTGTGKGTLKVYTPNLTSGTYLYSLVVDGKVMDSKKMMRIK